jgi:hypothetical protein
MTENGAVDAAIRLTDIPFVDFTTDLVVNVFDSLVQSHIIQMQEYANFINTVSQGLTEYINNTIDNVSFSDVSNLITSYTLPTPPNFDLKSALENMMKPENQNNKPELPDSGQPVADSTKWWGGLMNVLAPIIAKLTDKIKDPNQLAGLKAVENFNSSVTNLAQATIEKMPTYGNIHKSIAALIASNKYALLQNIVSQGMMQLEVTKGVIESRLNFNTYTYDNTSQQSSTTTKDKQKNALNNFSGNGFLGFITGKKNFNRNVSKVTTVTLESASSNNSNGTNINIGGLVRVEFATKK